MEKSQAGPSKPQPLGFQARVRALGFPTDSVAPTNFGVDTAGHDACDPKIATTALCSTQLPCYGCMVTVNNPVTSLDQPAVTYETVLKYARNNSMFLFDFGLAYTKIMTVGYLLQGGDGVVAGNTGKLGTLKVFKMS